MSKPIFVPYLWNKLNLLLRYDTVITTRTELAKELNIGSDQISKWQSGGEYDKERANLVPSHHFNRLLEIFNVSREWMESTKESDSESNEQLDTRLEMELRSRRPRSEWQNLFLEAEICDLLSIRRSPGTVRGLRPEQRPPGFIGECFFVGERVYIELNINTPWQTEGARPIAYLVLMMIDTSQITCLCPSEWYDASAHEIVKTEITIPNDVYENSLIVTGPLGIQSLVAILTKDPLPSALYNELMRPDHPDLRDCLTRITVEIQKRRHGDWLCFKQHYYVDQSV